MKYFIAAWFLLCAVRANNVYLQLTKELKSVFTIQDYWIDLNGNGKRNRIEIISEDKFFKGMDDFDAISESRVAVYGLGAIGLMIVQMAKLSGAERVFALDPIEHRRNLALKLGAEQVFDPTACDAGYEVKKATDKKGVDVAIDASGSYHALQAAIRSVHYSGLVVTCSFYQGLSNVE